MVVMAGKINSLFEDSPSTLCFAILFTLYGIGLDMGTTLVCDNWVFGCHESNRMLVDSTGRYLPLTFLKFNALGIASLIGPLAVFLGLAFKRYSLASLPFWYWGMVFAQAGAKNLVLLFS
jgi:hypothetical protein